MINESKHEVDRTLTREDLVDLLNDDLAGEYQAIISYVVYSQTMRGAAFMHIALELEKHAAEELAHAITIAAQIDYLGGMPTTIAKPVETSASPDEMLQFDLANENATIARYRERVRQCEALGEIAVAEHLREILVQEQDHQVSLANALGRGVPNVSAVSQQESETTVYRAMHDQHLGSYPRPEFPISSPVS